jgi:hypothetical protein
LSYSNSMCRHSSMPTCTTQHTQHTTGAVGHKTVSKCAAENRRTGHMPRAAAQHAPELPSTVCRTASCLTAFAAPYSSSRLAPFSSHLHLDGWRLLWRDVVVSNPEWRILLGVCHHALACHGHTQQVPAGQKGVQHSGSGSSNSRTIMRQLRPPGTDCLAAAHAGGGMHTPHLPLSACCSC